MSYVTLRLSLKSSFNFSSASILSLCYLIHLFTLSNFSNRSLLLSEIKFSIVFSCFVNRSSNISFINSRVTICFSLTFFAIISKYIYYLCYIYMLYMLYIYMYIFMLYIYNIMINIIVTNTS